MPTRDPPQRFDALFEAFQQSRRRHAWHYMHSAVEDVFTLDELTDEVLRREGTPKPRDEDASDLAVALHHVHLPKLDDAGLVDYDARDHLVRYSGSEHPTGPDPQDVASLLEEVEDGRGLNRSPPSPSFD